MSEHTPHPKRRFLARRPALALAAAGLVAVGGVAGAVAIEATRPSVTMAPATPVAIRSLSTSGIVTIRGRVAEVYGKNFILADATGRALVDTGRAGDDASLVRPGEPVTVQGRFDRGFVHASFLVRADGKVEALAPAGPPHDRHGGPRHGRDDGPAGDRDRDGPRAGAAPAPAPAPAAPANAQAPAPTT